MSSLIREEAKHPGRCQNGRGTHPLDHFIPRWAFVPFAAGVFQPIKGTKVRSDQLPTAPKPVESDASQVMGHPWRMPSRKFPPRFPALGRLARNNWRRKKPTEKPPFQSNSLPLVAPPGLVEDCSHLPSTRRGPIKF